ncbi:M48 family metalloprotease [Cohaesibacter celericrescens]|uniref:M48 family metalloprotease n=1 Tax=Cohaesibacter celericrescens TaxID=2067669 RepID=UPI003562040D
MTQASNDTHSLATAIHRFVLSGKNLWCVTAFVVFGGVATLFLMMTVLHSLDTARGLYHFVQEFNLYLHSNPMELVRWLGGVVAQFESARGRSILDLSAWAVTGVLVSILFIAHYRRFSRPIGASLTQNKQAGAATRELLARVGYFKDIQTPIIREGLVSNAFFSVGRVFFAPKGQVSRLLKGKPAENQTKTLTFFMVHEYAHAVTKDNLANSVFLVVISIYVFVFLSLLGPVLLLGSALASSSPMGPLLTVPLSLTVFLLFCSSVALCFYGMWVSYIKAREFFADQAAFTFVPDAENPYGLQTDLRRPDAICALSNNISGYERDQHRQGYSLHARNLLVFFWGVAFSIRTLYILVAPKDWCFSILAFDAAALAAFFVLYRCLPKRPPQLLMRPTFPWVLTFLSILAVEIAGPGLFGALKAVYWDAFSNENAQLMGLPGLILLLTFFFACFYLGIKKLVKMRKSEPRRTGQLLKRLLLRFMIAPGNAVEYFVVCVVVLLFCQPFLRHFITLEFLNTGLVVNTMLLGMLCLGVVFLYHQYKNFFVVNRTRFALVTTQGALIVFVMTGIMHLVLTDMLASARRSVLQAPVSWDFLIGLVRTSDLPSALIVGVISAIFYLMLRCVAYWARNKLDKIELNLEQMICR